MRVSALPNRYPFSVCVCVCVCVCVVCLHVCVCVSVCMCVWCDTCFSMDVTLINCSFMLPICIFNGCRYIV